jgi:hypothetical protein
MKNLRHVYMCTLQVSARARSENLGVHHSLTGLCGPVSNLTRRVSNKTFWNATAVPNYRLHFYKVMLRESRSMFEFFKSPVK